MLNTYMTRGVLASEPSSIESLAVVDNQMRNTFK